MPGMDGEDRLHPRFTERLVGHSPAERALLDALASGRMQHAWLITGPRGIGKATLAYRLARYLLSGVGAQTGTEASLFGEAEGAGSTLTVVREHSVFQRVAAGSHGNLAVVERGLDERRNMRRAEIVVDDVRRLQSFFTKTAAEPGWRIAIIDSADEMNRNASNALLKILEEPPELGLLLLIAHQPGRLLPTIRSRCRQLSLKPLSDRHVTEVLRFHHGEMAPEDLAALAVLAEGSPGRALALADEGGLAAYKNLVEVLHAMPGANIPALHALASKLAGRSAEVQYRVFTELLLGWIESLVRSAARGGGARAILPGETALFERFTGALPLDRWVELWEKMGRLIDRARAVHLDRKQVILSLLTMMDEAARGRMPAAPVS